MKAILNRSLLILMAIIIIYKTSAQEKIIDREIKEPVNHGYFGFGAGLDYGGFGIRGEYVIANSVGIFGGFGFNLYEPAYNAGLSFKLPGKKVQPVITGMYGYNGVIIIKNFTHLSKTYYGLSIGGGCEIKDSRNNKVLLEILYPFRNPEFSERIDSYENSSSITVSKVLPVTFTIGYNIKLQNSRPKRSGNHLE
ncbi:MAG: hypothetical protein ABIN97_09590 [Ginsengibacter sp.]